MGKNFSELNYPAELAARLQQQIQEVIETRGHVQDETPFTSAAGTRYYEYIFVPVTAPDGTVEAVAGSTRDITERKEALEATRKRATQLQQLAELATRINTAHDVDSIIGVVTEEARKIIGAHQAATNMVIDAEYPQPKGAVSSSKRSPVERFRPGKNGLDLYESLNPTNEPIRLTAAQIDSDPRWQTLRVYG